MNQRQIFEVDLFDSFLNLEKRVVEEVRMRATEYSRNFVCRGDVTFCGFICTKRVFGISTDGLYREQRALTWILNCGFEQLLRFLKECGGLYGPDKLDGP